MKIVDAKINIPMAYSISQIDGQLVGQYWEYYWEILGNGPEFSKGFISNPYSSSTTVTWTKGSLVDIPHELKCTVKIKPNANVITCEREVFISVNVDSPAVGLDSNVTLVESGNRCKVYNSVNSFQACCIDAQQIKWIIFGGKAYDENTSTVIGGSNFISDATNGCSTISVIWDSVGAPVYSISAIGISGELMSSQTTNTYKVAKNIIEPIITSTNTAIIGQDSSANISCGFSDYDWDSFQSDYYLDIMVSVGHIAADNITYDINNLQDSDFVWEASENIAGGTIGHYKSISQRIFSKSITVPATYDSNTPTLYRFKITSVAIRSNTLSGCTTAISSNKIADTKFTFCPVADNIDLIDGVVTKEPCDNVILLDAPSLIKPSAPTTITKGQLKVIRNTISEGDPYVPEVVCITTIQKGDLRIVKNNNIG